MKTIIAGFIVSASFLSFGAQAQTSPEVALPDSVKYGPKLLLQEIQTPRINYPQPLYFVNTKPVPFDSIKNLTTEHIKSIEILKDAKATAIYGSSGKHGVIIITLKDSIAVKQK